MHTSDAWSPCSAGNNPNAHSSCKALTALHAVIPMHSPDAGWTKSWILLPRRQRRPDLRTCFVPCVWSSARTMCTSRTECINTEIGRLPVPDLETDETWDRARSFATAFVSREVSVPLFGMPVIAGALTVAVSIYGARFLEVLLADPTAAEHDLRIINGVTRQLYRWYHDHVPAQQLQQVGSASRCMPPGHVSVYGCTTHLISEQLYRDCVAPLDEEVLSTSTSGGLIHLCGEHCRHIGTWREMASLRAVQLNNRASEDLEQYFTGLRDNQVIYLHPTDTMTVRRALSITGGRRIVIVSDGA